MHRYRPRFYGILAWVSLNTELELTRCRKFDQRRNRADAALNATCHRTRPVQLLAHTWHGTGKEGQGCTRAGSGRCRQSRSRSHGKGYWLERRRPVWHWSTGVAADAVICHRGALMRRGAGAARRSRTDETIPDVGGEL